MWKLFDLSSYSLYVYLCIAIGYFMMMNDGISNYNVYVWDFII